ncbi:hypothetical protein CsSME_00025679 [Camellia sinensis var. sinensis]
MDYIEGAVVRDLWGGRFVKEDVELGDDDFKWAFTGVYGPVRGVERPSFWEVLQTIAYRWGVPWCVGGDFNVVRCLEEKLGASSGRGPMRQLIDFWSPGIGRSISFRQLNGGYNVSLQIIGQFCWIVGVLEVVRRLFGLRICGYNLRALWR